MKSVLVTGGTVRIGKVIADYLRERGWKVITSSHRSDAGADIVADFSDPVGAVKLYAEVMALLGGNPPDAVVNNAALFTGDDALIESVNLHAPEKLTMLMAGRETPRRGAVVNVLDCRTLSAGEPAGAYEKSKASLLKYTRKSALLFSDTLRVNAVAPGPVFAPVDVHEQAGVTPLGRPRPEDVASAVHYLLGAESTTGAVIPVDGGQSLAEGVSE